MFTSAEILTSKPSVIMQTTPYESTITLSLRGITEKGHFTLDHPLQITTGNSDISCFKQMPLVFDVTDRIEEGITHIHNTHFIQLLFELHFF